MAAVATTSANQSSRSFSPLLTVGLCFIFLSEIFFLGVSAKLSPKERKELLIKLKQSHPHAHVLPQLANAKVDRTGVTDLDPDYRTPNICIAVLSCGRLDYLQETLDAITEHLDNDEPHLTYEIAWVDNGSADEDLIPFISRNSKKIHKRLLLAHNHGLAYGLNSLYFRLCSAPYVVTLEEDWVFRERRLPGFTEVSTHPHFLSRGMKVLQARPDLLGTFLRPEAMDKLVKKNDWQSMPYDGPDDGEDYPPIEYRTMCMNMVSGYVWGVYTNGGAMYDRRRLLELGFLYGEPGELTGFPHKVIEANYAFRAGLEFCSAELRVIPECESLDCNSLFDHVGAITAFKRPAQFKWIVYGTKYYEHLPSPEKATQW